MLKKLKIVLSTIIASLIFAGTATALEFQTDTSGDNAVKLDFTFGETLNITTSGNTVAIPELTPGHSGVSASNYTVTVNTNAQAGYTLSATVGCSSSDTNYNTSCYDSTSLSDGTNTFDMIAADGALSAGEWGIALVNTETVSSFKTLAKWDSAATVLRQTDTAGGGATPFRIGAAATNSQEAGTYQNRINFIAVANVACQSTISGTMQDFEPCSSIADGTSGTLTDSRDTKTYTVKKINGQWWMTQNLRYLGDTGSAGNTMTISNNNSNVANKSITLYSLNSSNAGNFNAYDSSKCGSGSTAGYNNACVYDSGSTSTGVWYNYYAASAGTISSNSNSTAATSDICPKNWHLPSGPNETEGTDLNILVGNTTPDSQNPTAGLSAFGAVVGDCYSNGSKSPADLTAEWWSATASSAQQRYGLGYNANYIPFCGTCSFDRARGEFVRCVMSS